MMILLLCFLLLNCPPAASQQQESTDWYYEKARAAIEAENFQTAVEIIEEGKQRFPEVAELRLLLADLYYDKELYNLALSEYREAEQLQGEEYLTLVQISRCYGKLNQEQDSISTLERILELYPESVSSVDDLGWMYFKTHQLEKGEQLLLEALERFGPDRGIYMTLGTLYSGMYDYENSRGFYLKAIEDALKEDDPYFASVAYYNLSLLEHSFYNYNSALRYTDESIQMSDRAPGHLARGELFQSRLDFTLALSEYQAAMVKDTTPLSKVNLALLYQKFGMLELSRRHAEEVLGSRDLAWMYYYGTDVERHLKDVHEILADVYDGLARRERVRPQIGIPQSMLKILRPIGYRLKAYYHRQKMRSYSLTVGHSYLQENNELDAFWEFYKANERYRRVALKYLRLARDLEVQVSPHAAAYYRQEEGKIRGSRELLERSIDDLDSFWEREGIFDSLKCLIPLLETGSPEQRQAVNRLFELNPGGLLQYGFALPLVIDPAVRGDGVMRRCIRFLKRSGSEIAPLLDEQGGFRYQLTLEREDDQRLRISLRKGGQGRLIFSQSLSLEQANSRRQAATLAQAVLEQIYKVRK
jgi:tetratricopeptide (TPR) repeat protein